MIVLPPQDALDALRAAYVALNRARSGEPGYTEICQEAFTVVKTVLDKYEGVE